MSEEKFMNKYRIPSARAPWHGYDGGAYFITICTHHHEHYFGKIGNGPLFPNVETLRATSLQLPTISLLVITTIKST